MLNPATPLSQIEYVLDLCDIVLIMTVNPGFGGQKFIPRCCRRSPPCAICATKRGLDPVIEVDGGPQRRQCLAAIEAGATAIVAGSAVFHAPDYAAAIAAIRNSGHRAVREDGRCRANPHRGRQGSRGAGAPRRALDRRSRLRKRRAASRSACPAARPRGGSISCWPRTPFREAMPWDRVHWFWGDERFVPWDDPDSNYGMAREAMLRACAGRRRQNIHRIATDGEPAEGRARL